MEFVCAIIVTYNPNDEILKLQYESLVNQVNDIIYVDNGSFNLVSVGKGNKINLISNDFNLGIAKAQNQGIRLAKEMGATHVLLMDQDSIPEPGMVKELIKPFKERDDIGAVGPCIVNAYNGQLHKYGFAISGFKLKKVPLDNEYTEVSYVIASGCLISMAVIDSIGGMNEAMFIDGVDFEWCLRAKSQGHKILQSSAAKLWHELGNGEKDRVLSHSPNREYYIVRNSFLMSKMSHLPFWYRMRRFLMGISRVVSCLSVKKGKYLRHGIKGLKDGLFSRTSNENVLLSEDTEISHK